MIWPRSQYQPVAEPRTAAEFCALATKWGPKSSLSSPCLLWGPLHSAAFGGFQPVAILLKSLEGKR